MNCLSCDLKVERTWNFCPQCGCILEKLCKCPECQTMIDRKWKYCHECGSSMISGRRKGKGLLDAEHVDAAIERVLREKEPAPLKSDSSANAGIWQAFTGLGNYTSSVRKQVFEVVVRQAMAGAPWKEICAGPMSVNNISHGEVEREVRRRRGLMQERDSPSGGTQAEVKEEDQDEDQDDDLGGGGLHTAAVPKKPIPPTKGGLIKLPLPKPDDPDEGT